MAKNDVTSVTTRAAARLLHRTVDYVINASSLSPSQQQAKRSNLSERLAIIYTAPRRPAKRASLPLCVNTEADTLPQTIQKPKHRKSGRENLLPQYRDGHDIDKVVSASLALWYNKQEMPGASYSLTINFSHKHKKQLFSTIQTALTKLFGEHQIEHFFCSFEVSKSARLHCHCMANIPDETNIKTLRLALQQRFGNSTEILEKLQTVKRIVDIRAVIHAPRERKSPEQWASYSMGDAMLTKAQLRWETTHYVSQSLKAHAKAVYEWLRKPDINQLPFSPEPDNSIGGNIEHGAANLTPAWPPATNENESALLDRFAIRVLRTPCTVPRAWKTPYRCQHPEIRINPPTTIAELAENWNRGVTSWIYDLV